MAEHSPTVGRRSRFSRTIFGTITLLMIALLLEFFKQMMTDKAALEVNPIKLIDLSADIYVGSLGLFIGIYFAPGLYARIHSTQAINFFIATGLHAATGLLLMLLIGISAQSWWWVTQAHWFWWIVLPDLISIFTFGYGAWVIASVEGR